MLRLKFAIALLLLSITAFANRVVVYGTVKFPNGVVAVNFPLNIQADTVAGNCLVNKSVLTNQNGSFEAVLECSDPIEKTIINYKDCEGQLVQVVKEVSSSYLVEYNIVLCAPRGCNAYFVWKANSTNNLSIQFNSSGSHASSPFPDEIVSRHWSWGDGSSIADGNMIAPAHVFQKAGTYEVCLKIITRNGCQATTCYPVVAGEDNQHCEAAFRYEAITGDNTSKTYIKFFSGNSTGTSNDDQVIGRRWNFGDGTSIVNNDSNIVHAYAHGGNYTVCLYIKTGKGCYDSVCREVVVPDRQPPHCEAAFSWVSDSLKFKFNSSISGVATGDSIIHRYWTFGDGTAMDGNTIEPYHVYQHSGQYEVCLRIVTKKGCEQKICKIINIESFHCKAAFRYEPITGDNTSKTYIKFFSGNSIGTSNDDQVIGRSWNFGDGTSLVNNDSNIVHAYAHGGTYTVCLYIKTGKGCYDSVCREVVVPDRQPTHCEPDFNWVSDSLKFKFNSSISGVATGDSIIHRYWTFGDGTAMDGNTIEPYHVYQHSGQYEVCLRIVTKKGCEQKICKIINIESFHCKAAFRYEAITGDNTSKTYIKFFSGNSIGTSNDDQVIGRSWNFGDGTSLVSNDSNIVHAYAHGGTYTVCLYIKTGKGCYDSVCREVVVPDRQPPHCEPDFNWVSDSLKFKFNSSISGVATGDSIIHRYWTFGDGIAMDGNSIEPYHVYQHSGQYEVCLRIVTRKGCEQKICKIINIESFHCKAAFRYEAITGDNTSKTYIKFFSGNSTGTSNDDQVIGRSWNFGDGTSLVNNDSNIVHAYAHGGTYTVCLYIKTNKGCYDSVCREVVVPDRQPPHCEPAFSWVSDSLKFKFNSSVSGVATGDSIIHRYWTFGDGTEMDGNTIEPYHVYQHSGQYEVCLRIVTKKGCEQKICKIINIESFHCKAAFRYEPITGDNTSKTYIKFFSGNSIGTSNDDQVIGRSWNFGDGTSLVSNDSNIVHAYAHGGTYTVCLYIKTGKGCYDSVCREVVVPDRQPPHCEPAFSWVSDSLKFKFNSSISGVVTGDSIIHRYWTFGDGTAMDGNSIEPYHVYQHSGQYEVCLRIVTKKGCEQKICRMVAAEQTNLKCHAVFRYENIGAQKLRFNSNASYQIIQDDSIVKRNWYFGDGSSLYGNTISPLHEYKNAGTYTACLVIVTKSGCESRICEQVKVDGDNISDSADIRLLTTYPNPATNNLYVTIWSKHVNVPSELSVYDIYGVKKWSKQIILPQGNSVWPVPTSFLLAGPYVFRLTTIYGTQHKNFIKIN